VKESAAKQKQHYDRIHKAYAQHYYDPTSLAFRERFIYRQIFADLDLNGKQIADLACGDGLNSLAVLKRFPGASVFGLDISSAACAAYQRETGLAARAADLTSGEDFGLRADGAMIIGGLHHCVADLPKTFRSIAHVVKPGGFLLMFEPNREYVLEGARRVWYRADAYFEADTEAALNHDEIARIAAPWFVPEFCRFMGGPAYFLIFNSLLFRIPVKAKPLLAPPLFALDQIYNLLPGRRLYPYFVARWRRSGTP
jgi:SAM-dependent methyltransferase